MPQIPNDESVECCRTKSEPEDQIVGCGGGRIRVYRRLSQSTFVKREKTIRTEAILE